MADVVRSYSSEQLLHRVQAEFIEMPGLRLTEAQAERLWGLDRQVCTDVLQMLIERKFLFLSADGTYSRFALDVREPRLPMARTAIRPALPRLQRPA